MKDISSLLKKSVVKHATRKNRCFYGCADIIPYPIVEIDSAGKIYHLNPAARKVFPDLKRLGKKHQLLSKLDFMQIFLKKHPKKIYLQEIQIKNAWFQIQARFDRDNQHIHVYINDTTASRLIIEKLRESEEKYRHIVKTSPIAIYEIDFPGKKFKSVNEGMCQALGYTEEELLKTSPLDILTPERRNMFNDRLMRAQKGEKLSDFVEYKVMKKDGTEIWGDINIKFKKQNGKIVGALVVGHDITQRKKIEKQLKESEEKYRHLVKHSPMATFEIDLINNKFISANEKVYKTLGYTEEEFLKIRPDDLLDEEGKKYFFNLLEKASRGESAPTFAEYKLIKKDGTFVWGDTNVKFKRENGRIVSALVASHDITDRKKIEDKLHRFSQAVEQSTASIVITDIDGNIEYVNQGFVDITGYSREEAIGKNPRILKSGQTNPTVYEDLWKTITSGREWSDELCNKKKNGDLYWEQVSISPVKDAHGRIINYLAVKNDITDQKKSEERIREVFRATEAGYYEQSIDKYAGFVSKRGAEILGFDQRDFVNYSEFDKWFNKRIHKEDLEKYRNAVLEFYTGKTHRLDVEFRFFKKDKSWKFLHIIATPLQRKLQGSPAYVAGLIFDITRLKKGEEIIRTSKEQLNLALSAAKMGTFTWNIIDDIRIWDENVYKLFGIEPKDFDGTSKNFLQLIHPDDRNRVKNDLTKAIKTSDYDTDYRIIWPNGQIVFIAARGKVYYDEDRKPIKMVAICWDITYRKIADQRKDDFITIAGHELRTPISAISIINQILRDKLSKNKLALSYLKKIENQTTIQVNLINDLLDVSRIQAGKLEVNKEQFNLQHLIKDTVDNLRETARENKIVLKIAHSPINIFSDKEKVREVLVNFCSNAIKFSPPGKEIIVRLETSLKNVIVSVSDFGIGIPKEYQNQIFEKFYRVYGRGEKSNPGLGMGLYISSEIIKLLKGKIWFESAPKKGSTFYFSLPLNYGN